MAKFKKARKKLKDNVSVRVDLTRDRYKLLLTGRKYMIRTHKGELKQQQHKMTVNRTLLG